MVNEVDESRQYFDEELLSRMKSTAQLIKQIEKNPQKDKINQIKKALISKNLKRQNQQFEEENMEDKGIFTSGFDYEEEYDIGQQIKGNESF